MSVGNQYHWRLRCEASGWGAPDKKKAPSQDFAWLLFQAEPRRRASPLGFHRVQESSGGFGAPGLRSLNPSMRGRAKLHDYSGHGRLSHSVGPGA